MVRQLNEINRQKSRGFDVSFVVPAFMKLCAEVDELWSKKTQKEKDEFETIY